MRAAPILVLHVARARNGVIGADGAIPWRAPSDQQRFKRLTMGKPLLMGRKTWESLPRRLPGRAHLVLTTDPQRRAAGGWTFSDWATMAAAGRAMAQASGAEEVCVIGGGQLYALAAPIAQRIYLTEVDAAPAGEALFPDALLIGYEEISRLSPPRGEKDEVACVFRVMERREPPGGPAG